MISSSKAVVLRVGGRLVATAAVVFVISIVSNDLDEFKPVFICTLRTGDY